MTNKDNDFSELNNKTSNDESFEEFKPDASAYQAEQESLNEVHKVKEEANKPEEISEDDKKYAPEYKKDLQESPEEKIEQEKISKNEVNQEEPDSEDEDRYKPKELRKNINPEKKEEKTKQKKYYGKEEPFAQYEPTFDEKELEPMDEADFEDPANGLKEEVNDIDETKKQPEENETTKSEFKSIYNSHQKTIELDEETRMYAGICHLTTVLGFTALWLPVIFFFIKNDDEDIKFHAKQATVLGFIFLLLIGTLLFVIFILQCLCCLSPFIILTIFILWCYAVYVSYMVFTGIDYRIPFICDLVDDIDF